MRFVRYQLKTDNPGYGWVLETSDGLLVGPIEGSPLGEFRRLEATIPIDTVRLLAPLEPGKLLCIGRNYVAHAREHGADVPEVPLIFLKPTSAIIGPDDAIILPPQSQQVEHEAELVVVIGKSGRWISPEEAANYILGYTIGNDVTARDLQRRDGQWTRAKGFDTFCPIGPWVNTDFDPADSMITCLVNGAMRQMASTRDMVFNIRQLIAYISSVMTLQPGDLIFTGTPAGVGPLNPGDIVEISIEGLGVLNNPVVSEPAH
jgi:2-keto-4-pentenoate hydratase/2-oxohepta-3-ene-1,7-dioic acid hydratase in catechol pathway